MIFQREIWIQMKFQSRVVSLSLVAAGENKVSLDSTAFWIVLENGVSSDPLRETEFLRIFL